MRGLRRMVRFGGRGVGFGLAGLILAAIGAAGAAAFGASSGSTIDCSTRAAVTHVQLSVAGGIATASFGIAPGCSGVEISLATYRASGSNGGFPQQYNDSSTGSFSAGGPYTVTVPVAPCYFQADLVLGGVITHLASTGNQQADIANGTLYGDRKLRVATGGTQSCGSGPPPVVTPVNIFVTCVTAHAESYDATFGYTDGNAAALTIAAGGTGNGFAPGPANRGQPSVFLTGSHAGAFTVSGIPLGTTLVWSLTSGGQTRTASASSASASCGDSPPPGTTTGTTTTTVTTGTTVTTQTPTTTTGPAVTVPSLVDVALTKTVSPAQVSVGATSTFTITVVNNGPGAATGTSVLDALPPGLTLVSAKTTLGSCVPGPPIACAIGSLPSGGSAIISVVVRAATPGGHLNRASVTETQADSNLANNTAQASLSARGPFVPPAVPKAKPKKDNVAAAVRSGAKPHFTG